MEAALGTSAVRYYFGGAIVLAAVVATLVQHFGVIGVPLALAVLIASRFSVFYAIRRVGRKAFYALPAGFNDPGRPLLLESGGRRARYGSLLRSRSTLAAAARLIWAYAMLSFLALWVLVLLLLIWLPFTWMTIGWVREDLVDAWEDVGVAYRRARHARKSSVGTLGAEERADTLILWSFDYDDKSIHVVTKCRCSLRRKWLENFFVRTEPVEEIAVRWLAPTGRTVAIGNPSLQARDPPLGARRLVVNPNEWQDAMRRLTASARQVVFILGRGSGLEWELAFVLRSSAYARTILVFPPSPTFAAYGATAITRVVERLPAGWFESLNQRMLGAVLDAGQLTVFTGPDTTERSYEVALEAASALIRERTPALR